MVRNVERKSESEFWRGRQAQKAIGWASRKARYHKKGRHLLREQSKIDYYEFMLEHLLCFNVVRMTKVFEVSRSGFYYWIKHRHKAIQKELAENGDSRNVKTIVASMKR